MNLQLAPVRVNAARTMIGLISYPMRKDNEYPGVVPSEKGERLCGRTLTHEERSVRGTMVIGLTASDIAALDNFEGDVRISALFI